MENTFPELESSPVSCNSWVVTNKNGAIFETWNRKLALISFNNGCKVQTSYDYLTELNKNTK